MKLKIKINDTYNLIPTFFISTADMDPTFPPSSPSTSPSLFTLPDHSSATPLAASEHAYHLSYHLLNFRHTFI